MAQYYWTAEDYGVGDTPSEWTAHANIGSYEIDEDTSGEKFLSITAGNAVRAFLEFNPAESTTDGEVWVRWLGGSTADVAAFLRGQNLDNTTAVSSTRLDHIPRDTEERLSEYVDGTWNGIATQSLTVAAGEIGQARGSFSGDTLEGRWWVDGNSEPGSWELTGTTQVTESGLTGITPYRDDDIRIYEFGVGTSGDTAPTEPLSTTVSVSGTFTVDGAGVEGADVTVLDTDASPPTVIGTTTTASDGSWSVDVSSGTTVECIAAYTDGNGDPVTVENQPYIVVE